jgi:hypothetical protein
MAVRAEEHTLLSLVAQMCHRARKTALAQLKALAGRVEVMELKRGLMLVEAAKDALATSLLDDLPLHATAPGGYGRAVAPAATKTSIGAGEEGCVAVPRASEADPLKAFPSGDLAFLEADSSVRREIAPTQPVANSRVADT